MAGDRAAFVRPVSRHRSRRRTASKGRWNVVCPQFAPLGAVSRLFPLRALLGLVGLGLFESECGGA